MLIFTRLGTAFMIMPGIGDSFVPRNVRLIMAVAMSFVLAPVVQGFVPSPLPALPIIFSLLVMEFIIGLFIGTLARILMVALDVAGMIIAMTSGLANAQVFNPALASQGSITGAFLSMLGAVLLFATNLHHMLIYGLVQSYNMFPVGEMPDPGGMTELLVRFFATSFLIGFQISVPFIMVAMMLYIGMGVLTRVMPQVQVFILALPIQIMLAILTLFFILSAGMLFWMDQFETGMAYFFTNGGG